MSFTVKHVYQDFLKLGTVPGIEENDPPCDYNNGDYLPCNTSNIIEGTEDMVKLYPNPFSDILQFEALPVDFNIEKVWAVDMLGRKLELKMLNTNSIDTKALSPGKYQIILENKNGERLRFTAVK